MEELSDEQKEDIWAEIDAIYKLPEREDGDIDSIQMSVRYGINQTSALRRMQKLVASGEYKYEVVKDVTCANGKRKIIRKVK
jgi:hypothetical protein